MPSDESGRGPSIPPTSPPRAVDAAVASSRRTTELVAWGPIRDAITAIHNLESLLKSPRIGSRVLSDVVPEVRAGAALLRDAFVRAAEGGARSREAIEARSSLRAFAAQRLDELEDAMAPAAGELDVRARLSMEQRVARVGVDLSTCIELLELAERAEHALPTELAVEELVYVSMRNEPRPGEREIPVRFARHNLDCALSADPHVFRRLVAFAVARVHAEGAAMVSFRVHCDVERASVEIAATSAAELSLSPLPMRLIRRIAPTDAIFEAAAAAASIEAARRGTTFTLSVARAH